MFSGASCAAVAEAAASEEETDCVEDEPVAEESTEDHEDVEETELERWRRCGR